ncbi:pre-mRNA-processing ATP-dependent RNA helicase PRP5-like isoform X2 [Papaver somniferum]|uniref:pre-mRNA-processing ATP-dependent RNA helicase PRP5-like isoform X2 n=1 Tax=Papaver somniferum TaxID=3469 RepID=UPI000E6FC914|nr:pre-mRNA-processing ATP-dependent RNA helicase PRP5-like isoform X2 [Papaver somniferum]
MELPFQWGGGNGRYPYFHGVAGEDRIIIESYPTISASDIEKVRLYSYDWNKKTSTKKAKDGVVSELVSVSLFSKLAFVTLFRSFAESLWPVRGRQFRHQETEKARLRLNVDITAAPDSAPAPAPIESFTNMAQAMPVALNGRDLSGCAETGSGKIAAFAIPMIQHCLAQPSVQRGDGPLALGLAPTRERAQQIEKEVRLLIIYHKISGIFAPVLSSYVYYTIRFFVS